MSSKPKILLVEDDQSFGKILRDYLTLNNLEVTHARDGVDGWQAFRNHHFDLCILDVMMPKRDGLELATQIRATNRLVPVIFLTAKGRKEDMVNGFETGADDYLVKPVDADILLHKIKAILKRSAAVAEAPVEEAQEFVLGSLAFNYPTRTLHGGATPQVLSPKEAEVLRLLCLHQNNLVRREDILRQLWREVNYFTGRSLDVYIARLRKYLAADETVALNNLHKSGYVLEVKTAPLQ